MAPWEDSEELEDVADEVGLEEPTAEEIADALDEIAEVEATEAGASDEPVEDVADEVVDDRDETAEPSVSGPTADAEDIPLFQTPAPPAHRPTGKPSVPSFDDILFGPGPGK